MADDIRESISAETLAAKWECDPSTIRKLLKKGELEGHRVGRSGLRVYVDSAAAYQQRNNLEGKKPPKVQSPPPQRERRRLSRAQQRAIESLRKAGI